MTTPLKSQRPRAVLVNSIPKAGTHLVSKALSLVPGMDGEYERLLPDAFVPTGDEATVQLGIGLARPASARRVRKVLASLAPGRFALWHVPYSDEFAAMLRELRLPMVIAVRQPAMLVASHIMHIRKFEGHRLHARFAKMSYSAQVSATIDGVRDKQTGEVLLESIELRYARLLAWRSYSPSLLLRFEDLIGRRGGGDEAAQRNALRELLAFVDGPTDDDTIERIAREMYGNVVTFRRGQVNGWEDVLSVRDVQSIETKCAQVMGELGYGSQAKCVHPFIVNSFPKSGTKLLCKVCAMLPGVRMLPPSKQWRALSMMGKAWEDAPTIGTAGPKPTKPTTPAEAAAILNAMPAGGFIEHHLAFSEEIAGLLRQRDVRMLMMVRDPRDAVLSLAEFLPRAAHHPLHGFFMRLSPEERIHRAIVGVRADESDGIELADVGARYRRRVAWLKQSNVCVVRFEDLVGQTGGGDTERQRTAIESIIQHLGVSASSEFITELATASFGGTRTFLYGRIGRWRESFTSEHRALFDRLAGDILKLLGYDAECDA